MVLKCAKKVEIFCATNVSGLGVCIEILKYNSEPKVSLLASGSGQPIVTEPNVEFMCALCLSLLYMVDTASQSRLKKIHSIGAYWTSESIPHYQSLEPLLLLVHYFNLVFNLTLLPIF
jgi:hypothetical protein